MCAIDVRHGPVCPSALLVLSWGSSAPWGHSATSGGVFVLTDGGGGRWFHLEGGGPGSHRTLTVCGTPARQRAPRPTAVLPRGEAEHAPRPRGGRSGQPRRASRWLRGAPCEGQGAPPIPASRPGHRRRGQRLHQRQLRGRLPAAERVHRHAGAAARDLRGLLAHGVGAALGHHRHDDAAGGEVTGEAWGPPPGAPAGPGPHSRLRSRPVQIKCDQYWPNRGTETYGCIQVTLLDTIELATFCVRTFSLHKVRPWRGRRRREAGWGGAGGGGRRDRLGVTRPQRRLWGLPVRQRRPSTLPLHKAHLTGGEAEAQRRAPFVSGQARG